MRPKSRTPAAAIVLDRVHERVTVPAALKIGQDIEGKNLPAHGIAGAAHVENFARLRRDYVAIASMTFIVLLILFVVLERWMEKNGIHA